MNNSGNSTRSAPSAMARERATRAFAALPSISPMVGLSWASVTANASKRSVMAAVLALEESQSLDDGDDPECAGHQQRDAHCGRAHVLDPADLLVVIHGQAIGELLDRSVEQLDDQHEQIGRA